MTSPRSTFSIRCSTRPSRSATHPNGSPALKPSFSPAASATRPLGGSTDGVPSAWPADSRYLSDCTTKSATGRRRTPIRCSSRVRPPAPLSLSQFIRSSDCSDALTAEDEIERLERRNTAWMLIAQDTTSMTTSGWPGCVDDKAYVRSSSLPGSQCTAASAHPPFRSESRDPDSARLFYSPCQSSPHDPRPQRH